MLSLNVVAAMEKRVGKWSEEGESDIFLVKNYKIQLYIKIF